MKNKILEYLSSIELIHNITIVYACESGSRMWNIACEDSDYDVRFIYYRPLDDYFLLDKKPNVLDSKKSNIIEEAKKHNIDIVGWDIRKYLELFAKSNSTTFEWLESPIKYKINDYFLSSLRALKNEYFNHHKIFISYYGLAQSNTKKYLCGETVKIKKYLYSIRPILICAWMLIFPHKIDIPLDFNVLKGSIRNNDTKKLVDNIIADRISEKDEREKIKVLDEFINEWLQRLKMIVYEYGLFVEPKKKHGTYFVDKLLFNTVMSKYAE